MNRITAAAGLCVLLGSCAAPWGGRADTVWEHGVKRTRVTEFVLPWSGARTPPRTEFRAHTAGDRLHFTFDADDPEIILAPEWQGEPTLSKEDRVEVFFAADPALARYYCIEIDPLGRVNDYAASHYRRYDRSWQCPGLRVAARRTATGYRVDGSIPRAALAKLLGTPVEPGAVLRVGLFRADFFGSGPTARGKTPHNWLSWKIPVARKPDFHIPSAFGDLPLPPTGGE